MISTVLSLGVLYVFYRVVGLSATWANVVATTIATVPSYYLNRTWAWGHSGKSHLWREVVPFWAIAFVSLGLSTLAVTFAAREAHHLARAHEVQTGLVLLANFITYGAMWVGKFMLFNKVLFKHREPAAVSMRRARRRSKWLHPEREVAVAALALARACSSLSSKLASPSAAQRRQEARDMRLARRALSIQAGMPMPS